MFLVHPFSNPTGANHGLSSRSFIRHILISLLLLSFLFVCNTGNDPELFLFVSMKLIGYI